MNDYESTRATIQGRIRRRAALINRVQGMRQPRYLLRTSTSQIRDHLFRRTLSNLAEAQRQDKLFLRSPQIKKLGKLIEKRDAERADIQDQLQRARASVRYLEHRLRTHEAARKQLIAGEDTTTEIMRTHNDCAKALGL